MLFLAVVVLVTHATVAEVHTSAYRFYLQFVSGFFFYKRKPTHPISSSRKALISITLLFLICRQTKLTRNAWDRKSCNYTWSYKRYKDTKREVTQSHAVKTKTFEVISFKLKQDFQFKRLYLHFLFLELWLHRYKRVYSFYMHSNDIILKRGNEKINK